MDKRWNKWLIIAGVLFILLNILTIKVSLPFSLIVFIRLLIPIIIVGIPLGIVNYTKWNIWIKVIAVVLGMILMVGLLQYLAFLLSPQTIYENYSP